MDMEFYLMTDSEEPRPTQNWEEVGTALSGVTSGDTEFVVLSKGESGEDYIQTSMWNAGMILRPSYIAEISISGDRGARHYRMKTKDFHAIYSAFRAYFDGWDPVVTKWDDVTDEFTD